MDETIRIEVQPPPRAEYLYGRVMLPGLADLILGGEQVVHADTATFYRYAESREDGIDFAAQIASLGLEIVHLGEDMHTFVKTHESEKWED